MSGRWLLAAVLAVVSAAVTTADSMFSFGTATLGYWASVVDARALGMGGANFAVVDDDNVVLGNPAAVTGHPHTTWSVVGAFERREVEDISGFQQTFHDDSPRYLRIIVPLAYGAKMTAGLAPVSDLAFRWATDRSRDGVAVNEAIWADGGLWKGMFGVGRAVGPLRLGLDLGFIRGRMETEWRIDAGSPVVTDKIPPLFGVDADPITQGTHYSLMRTRTNSPILEASYLISRSFNGLQWTLGAIYDVNEELSTGLHFRPRIALDERRISSSGVRFPTLDGRHNDHQAELVAPDWNDTTDGSADLPRMIGVGLSWQRTPVQRIAADLTYQAWSGLNDAFDDVVNWNLGAELQWTDDYQAPWWQRLPVRIGVRGESHYTAATVGGGRPEATFFSFGTGFLLGGDTGRIDWAVEWGTRGSVGDTGAKESVVRHVISAVGWDKWFERRSRR